jgi:hypothetical protein
MGGLLWILSRDPQRHRRVLRYLGAAFVIFGTIALGVDFPEGMPRFWSIGEGPIVIFFVGMILALSRDQAERRQDS